MTYKHPGGRPLKFKTVEELEYKIELWLSERKNQKLPLTITSLAVYLDTSRETLLDYEDKDEYSDAIKKAKMLCHQYAEDALFRETGQVAGAIFSLKNNYDWRDKSELDLGGGPIDKLLDKFGLTENTDDRKGDEPVQGSPQS